MRKFLILLFILFISVATYSQKSILSGIVTDADKFPVQNAVIALLTPKDSILYRFTRSDKDGKFNFQNLKLGSFVVMTSHKKFADYVENIDIKENDNS